LEAKLIQVHSQEQELTSQQQQLREESSQMKQQLADTGKEVKLHKDIMMELLSKWEEFSVSDTKEKQMISGKLYRIFACLSTWIDVSDNVAVIVLIVSI
jgi:hypothetical protein